MIPFLYELLVMKSPKSRVSDPLASFKVSDRVICFFLVVVFLNRTDTRKIRSCLVDFHGSMQITLDFLSFGRNLPRCHFVVDLLMLSDVKCEPY